MHRSEPFPLWAAGPLRSWVMAPPKRKTGGRFGLQTMCEGGGMANATIIERLG